MREKAVDRAIEIAAVRLDRLCDVGKHGGGNVEARMMLARDADPRLQYTAAQLLIERPDIDAESAGQPRAHPFLEAFQIGRRTIRRDHNLTPGIKQRIERVAELLLDHLALQELDIVDDEKIDGTHLLLESDRVLRAQRRHESVHEFLGGEIDHAAAGACASMRDGLDDMRLSETDIGVDEQRIEHHGLARFRAADTLRGRMRQPVRRANQEIVERHAPIERRTGKSARLVLDRIGGDRSHRRRDNGRFCNDCRFNRPNRRPNRRAQGRAHVDVDRLHRAHLGVERGADAFRIMPLDPGFQKFRRHRKQRCLAGELDKFETNEP